jgi:hypothetical protein
MGSRKELTPHMADYEQRFADDGDVHWLPYLMYFHPYGHRSAVVNTDALGFRYSEHLGRKISVADHQGVDAVRLIAGSSTVFGIGASHDRWTLASCLSANDTRGLPWLNLGGRSFNSTQELMLMVLNRHLFPTVKEIVLFSGFNNLGLARLPKTVRGEHGAFFNCNQFDSALNGKAAGNLELVKNWLVRPKVEKEGAQLPGLEEQIAYAVDLTVRHLHTWKILADDMGAKLTFVLQPLSGWVRSLVCKEEQALFSELDQLGNFSEVYGDILSPEVCAEYARRLEFAARLLSVDVINISPILGASLAVDDWMFVDRIHFTDWGHDFVSQILLEATKGKS